MILISFNSYNKVRAYEQLKYILSKIINKEPWQKDTHDSPFSSLTFQIHIHIHISSLYNHRILPVTIITAPTIFLLFYLFTFLPLNAFLLFTFKRLFTFTRK